MKENVVECSMQYFKGSQINQEILFRKKLIKLKNLILPFSVAINDRINALMLSALVRSFIQGVNITERQMSGTPKGKSKLQRGGDMSANEGIDEV